MKKKEERVFKQTQSDPQTYSYMTNVSFRASRAIHNSIYSCFKYTKLPCVFSVLDFPENINGYEGSGRLGPYATVGLPGESQDDSALLNVTF